MRLSEKYGSDKQNGQPIKFKKQLISVEPIMIGVLSGLDKNGHQALIVGGAVRDAIQGFVPKDIDIEVYNITYADLSSYLSKYGKVNLVGKNFGVVKFKPTGGDMEYDFSVPRKENKIGLGHKSFEVTFDESMTIKEAALRRDFTFNALAYDPITNEVYDYFGGVKDLENKIIRHTSDKFQEDALRILRAMQFQARFGFTIAPETIEEIRGMLTTKEFADLPKERIFEEWRKWAEKGVRHDLIFEFLRDTTLIDYYPELKLLKETPQDKIWHPEGDVEIHTTLCLKRMDEIIKEQDIHGDEKTILVMSVLFHDIAKPQTTEELFKNGRMSITSHGHEALGGEMVKEILPKMGFYEELVTPISNLVANHLAGVSISLISAQSGKVKSVKKLSKRLFPATIQQLLYVMDADSNGRGGYAWKEPTGAKEMSEIAKDLKVTEKPYEYVLMGRHLIAAGLKPSPEFGEILRQGQEAQENGEFSTVEEGKRWLSDYLQNTGKYEKGGTVGSQQKQAFDFIKNYLGIKSNVILKDKKNKLVGDSQSMAGVGFPKDNTFTVEISFADTINGFVRRLAHEMVHVKQIEDGRLVLVNDDEFVFDGKKYNFKTYQQTYHEDTYPFETEAFDQERTIANAFWNESDESKFENGGAIEGDSRISNLIDELIAEERAKGYDYPQSVNYKTYYTDLLSAKGKKQIMAVTSEADNYLKKYDKNSVSDNKKADIVRDYLFDLILKKRLQVVDKYDTSKIKALTDEKLSEVKEGFNLPADFPKKIDLNSSTDRELREIFQRLYGIIETLDHPEIIGLYEESAYPTMSQNINSDVRMLKSKLKRFGYDYWNDTFMVEFEKLIKEAMTNKYAEGGEVVAEDLLLQVKEAKNLDTFLSDIITDYDVRYRNRKAAEPLVKMVSVATVDKIKPYQAVEEETVKMWQERIEAGKRPFVIIRTDNTIDGHHKFTAYKREGFTEVPVVYESDLIDFYNSNKTLSMADGGEITHTSYDKVASASSRFRPKETIIFEPPIIGKNGVKLVSYTWAWMPTSSTSREGDEVMKRVSDWTQAELSADSGRNVVHQYTVQYPDKTYKTVSAESVPVLLGYVDRKDLKSFPNLVTAAKTLAKQQMQLAIWEAQEKEYNDLKARFEKEEKPPIIRIDEPVSFVRSNMDEDNPTHTVYSMGDVWYRQDNPYDYTKHLHVAKSNADRQTIENLTYSWINKRVEENGGINPRGLYDLRNRIVRHERKIKQILEQQANGTFESGGEIEDLDDIETPLEILKRYVEVSRNFEAFKRAVSLSDRVNELATELDAKPHDMAGNEKKLRAFYNKEKKVIKERRALNKIESARIQAEWDLDKIEKLAFAQSAEMDRELKERFGEYGKGGEVDPDNKETYAKWKSLINMSKSELEKFYNSEEGKGAGLSVKAANELGIHNGRESARWIMKMKGTPVGEWTPEMWDWAKRQISFVSRMSGNKGGLYDDKGNKTRKHTSLLIWGHNPEKKGLGGEFEKGGALEVEYTHDDGNGYKYLTVKNIPTQINGLPVCYRGTDQKELDTILQGGNSGGFWRGEPNEYRNYGQYLLVAPIPNPREVSGNESKGAKEEWDSKNYVGYTVTRKSPLIIIDKLTSEVIFDNATWRGNTVGRASKEIVLALRKINADIDREVNSKGGFDKLSAKEVAALKEKYKDAPELNKKLDAERRKLHFEINSDGLIVANGKVYGRVIPYRDRTGYKVEDMGETTIAFFDGKKKPEIVDPLKDMIIAGELPESKLEFNKGTYKVGEATTKNFGYAQTLLRDLSHTQQQMAKGGSISEESQTGIAVGLNEDELHEKYSYGYCPYLAVAMHDVLGWQIEGYITEDKTGKFIDHAWVNDPHGRDIDIYGFGGAQDFYSLGGGERHLFDREEFINFVNGYIYDRNFPEQEEYKKAVRVVHEYMIPIFNLKDKNKFEKGGEVELSKKEDFHNALKMLLLEPNTGLSSMLRGKEEQIGEIKDAFTYSYRGTIKKTVSVDVKILESGKGTRYIVDDEGLIVAAAFVDNDNNLTGIITENGFENVGIGTSLLKIIQIRTPDLKLSGVVSQEGQRLVKRVGMLAKGGTLIDDTNNDKNKPMGKKEKTLRIVRSAKSTGRTSMVFVDSLREYKIMIGNTQIGSISNPQYYVLSNNKSDQWALVFNGEPKFTLKVKYETEDIGSAIEKAYEFTLNVFNNDEYAEYKQRMIKAFPQFEGIILNKEENKFENGGEIGTGIATNQETTQPEMKAYLMTQEEYLTQVAPVLKAYKDFLKKNKYFISEGYGSLPTISYPEIVDAMNRKEDIGHFGFKKEWMADVFPWFKEYKRLWKKYGTQSWTDIEKVATKEESDNLNNLRNNDTFYKDLSSEERGQYDWNSREERLFEGWDRKYYSDEVKKDAPASVIAQKNEFVSKLRSLYGDWYFEHSISEPDNLKSNKRAIKYAIDRDVYTKLLKDDEVAIEDLQKYAESAGVKIPKKVSDMAGNAATIALDKVYDAIYKSLPSINRDVLSKLIEDIKESFKPFEKEIFDRTVESYKRTINMWLSEKEMFEASKLTNSISFSDKIFVAGKSERRDIPQYSSRKGRESEIVGYSKILYIGNLKLINGWEANLNKIVQEWVDGLKAALINAIVSNLTMVTSPIKGYSLRYLGMSKTRQNFDGVIKFDFENGSSFILKTQAVLAGIGVGGFVQQLHFRYLSDFMDAHLADGTTLPNPSLAKIIEHFSDKVASEQLFNPYIRVSKAETPADLAQALYDFMKSGYGFKNVRITDNKEYAGVSFKEWDSRRMGGEYIGFSKTGNKTIEEQRRKAVEFLDKAKAPKPTTPIPEMAEGGTIDGSRTHYGITFTDATTKGTYLDASRRGDLMAIAFGLIETGNESGLPSEPEIAKMLKGKGIFAIKIINDPHNPHQLKAVLESDIIGGTYEFPNETGGVNTVVIKPVNVIGKTSKEYFSVWITLRSFDTEGREKIINRPIETLPVADYPAFMEDLKVRGAKSV